MATPTFTGLDIGLPGGALYVAGSAKALCSVEIGPIQVAQTSFAFTGFPGTFKVNMGPRTRLVTWVVVLRCITLTVLNTIEAAIDTLIASAAVGTLTDTQARSYSNVIVQSFQAQRGYDTIQGGAQAGWVRKEGRIVFEVLTP